MKLPQESERISHGSAERIIDAHKDYKEYQKELLEDNSREKYNKKTENKAKQVFFDPIKSYKAITASVAQYLENQRFELNKTVDEKSGQLIHCTGIMTNYLPIPVQTGDVITPLKPGTDYSVAFYSNEIADELIYTYTYAPESNWASFKASESFFRILCSEKELESDGFVRLMVRSDDNIIIPPRLNELFAIEKKTQDDYIAPVWMEEEAENVIKRV